MVAAKPPSAKTGASSETSDEQPGRPVRISVVRTAVSSFAELTQQQPERVTGIRRTQDGWSVLVDVVDVERIPATMSVMATYRLETDEDGELLGYERLRRFARSATDQR